MQDIFLDTTQTTFVALFFENNQCVFKFIEKTKFKVELVALFFEKIKDKINWHEVNFYLNIGPGSFSGCRIGLVYLRTLAQIKKIDSIFITNTFLLLNLKKINRFKKNLFIKANSLKQFKYNQRNKSILIEPLNEKKCLQISYEILIKKFYNIKNVFTKTKINEIKPYYILEPNIGKKKEGINR